MHFGLIEHLQGLGRYISYYPGFNHITGHVFASILLYELIYQEGVRLEFRPEEVDPEHGIKFEEQDLMNATGLSRSELKSARNHLRLRGLVKETVKGMPRKVYYKLESQTINERWQAYLESGECAALQRRAELAAHREMDKARESSHCADNLCNVEQIICESSHCADNLCNVEPDYLRNVEQIICGTSIYSKTLNTFSYKRDEPETERDTPEPAFQSEPSEPVESTIDRAESLSSQKSLEPKPIVEDDYSAAPDFPCEKNLRANQWNLEAAWWRDGDRRYRDSFMQAVVQRSKNGYWGLDDGRRNDIGIRKYLRALESTARFHYNADSLNARNELLDLEELAHDIENRKSSAQTYTPPVAPIDIPPANPEKVNRIKSEIREMLQAAVAIRNGMVPNPVAEAS